jgi:hypothetical protein
LCLDLGHVPKISHYIYTAIPIQNKALLIPRVSNKRCSKCERNSLSLGNTGDWTQALYPLSHSTSPVGFLFLCFWARVSLCSPGWPGSSYVVQGVPELKILLPWLPDYRRVPPHPIRNIHFEGHSLGFSTMVPGFSFFSSCLSTWGFKMVATLPRPTLQNSLFYFPTASLPIP